MAITFKTTLKAEGNNTGIEVPPDVMTALGTSKKPAVVVTVAGYTYRSTVAVMGGHYMIALSRANREAAGVKGGDDVEVTLELDTAPRTVEIPDDLAAALAEKPGAAAAFDALAPSKKKEFVRQVVEAKAEDTRNRRVAKIVAELG